ncbi:ubiquitin-like protein [Thermochaetoides thermophila DSM 1495]|uniref:Ubiquitin-like protein n=1 Tax=Chaetomium thermophilum (strain DSM 1495 / CBS 144.50 / IMI 039719) TaxID=759272 RepID=G0SCW7_CHATD|nr:ubiquitin-like protein [Thermochaetoides thermophila DSM 1495]EGS19238.1 ubiquitin-like protein [Thermochaetoides thermophila DSM 1495]
MADSAEAGGEAQSQQITFKVKSSNDKTHTITMDESATVLDLKTKLSGPDFEDIPVDRQRLIYSGRIMKDSDTLSVYKIKPNNTIHLVKSARSNQTAAASTPASTSASSSTPTPAVPQNMAAGTSAGDPLAALTGARYAGLANLPSFDLFGADGGMGAPPSDEQIADMLSNPAVAQSMQAALNNPNFVDYMIQMNPMLASMPNAREVLNSPQFRALMTNPEAIRMAARLRRVLQESAGANFPAPGAVDNASSGQPAGSPTSGGNANSANNANDPLRSLFGMPGLFGAPLGSDASNPFAALFGAPPPASNTGGTAAGATSSTSSQPAASVQGGSGSSGSSANTPNQPAGTAPPFNPFAALFGGANQANNQGGASLPNPFGLPLPPIPPETFQQMAQAWGFAPPAVAPQDNRPPEERYAEQLRQLNDMGFFDFERNVAALRRSGGSVQGAIEYLLSNP